MKKMGTSWNKDDLFRSSIRATIAFNATEKFAAAAGPVLIGTANKTIERAQCIDDPAISSVASRFAFSAVTEADYTFIMREVGQHE
jgi:hypothetical protein